MSDILFAHPKSIHLLNVYPYILIMDSTCKTNRYLMPLFEVVGIAPTAKSFSVAFVFLKNEKEDSYTWALEHLKLLIDSDDFSKAVVTNRELALVNALKNIFPNSYHILCKHHIGKNVEKYCTNLVKNKDVGTFF